MIFHIALKKTIADEAKDLEDIEAELQDLGFNSDDIQQIFSELDQVISLRIVLIHIYM